jgi:membrane protein
MRLKELRKTRAVSFFERVIKEFNQHDCMSMAAAVAFYTALSFAPLVLLIVTVGSFMGEETQGKLVSFFSQQLGPRASQVTEAVVESADQDSEQTGTLRWAFGLVMLLITASGVFAQLQAALNRIWEAKPPKGAGWWHFIRRRLLSLGMVLTAMFILLVSLLLSAVVESIAPSDSGLLARLGVLLASFVVATLLFAAVFKMLPDTPIPWRHVWFGALVTSGLFSLGKFILGIYFERSGVGEGYGEAAGALIALLVWVYYSCIILFVGAEITRQWSRKKEETEGPREETVARAKGKSVAEVKTAREGVAPSPAGRASG